MGGGALLTASLTDTRSAELYRRALHVLPGGVNSPVRAMRSIGRDPLFVERAAGAEITDVDGNVYVDYVCSWGPLIHGHAHPAVLEAIAEAAALGTTFGAATAGIRAHTSSASSTSPAVGAPYDVPSAAASVTAAMTAGCAWPWISGPHEHT